MNGVSGSMPSDLKEENRRSVLQAFRDGNAMTANDVSAKTGISRQTVKKYIEYYAAKGLLASRGKGSSSQVGGKRPELFSLNGEVRLVCIALHHQDIQMTLTNLHHDRLATWSSGEIHLENLDAMWRQIRTGRDALLKEEELSVVVGVGMAVPFASDNDGLLTVATPFPHWPQSDYGRSMRLPLEEMFPSARKVLIISDGRASGRALLRERPRFLTEGTLAAFYTSYGIGGVVITGGVMEQNLHTIVGAFGHLTVDTAEEEVCTCGGRGCLEQMVNRARMHRRLNERFEEYRQSCLASTPPDKVTFQQLFAGSAAGDTLCQAESRYYAGMFAVALRNLYLSAGPDLVVLQGDFGQADEVFKQELLARLHSFKYIESSEEVNIEYDLEDLSLRESEGLSYLLAEDYLENPKAYI